MARQAPAGTSEPCWRPRGNVAAGRRPRGNVSAVHSRSRRDGGQLGGSDVDHDQGSVLTGPVRGRGLQEAPRHSDPAAVR